METFQEYWLTFFGAGICWYITYPAVVFDEQDVFFFNQVYYILIKFIIYYRNSFLPSVKQTLGIYVFFACVENRGERICIL